MPEHLRALVVILIIAAVIFALAKAPARSLLTGDREFERRRNLWFGVTLAAFLSHNFWLFILLAAALLFVTAKKDENKIGLVLFVLLAVPPMPGEIPGFGVIRYFFTIDYLKVISIAILLPVFIEEVSKDSLKRFTGEFPDKLLLAYIFLILGLTLSVGTFTGTMRTAFLFFVDVVLPYAVASRLPNSVATFRSALSSYVIGAAVLSGLGIFEFLRKWLLYSSLDEAFGINWELGHYLMREESLRALVTAGQPIPFGYAMAVGFVLMLGLGRFFIKRSAWLAGLLLLALGLFSSVSRGPWFGALAGVLVFILTGPKSWKNIVHLLLLSILLIPVLLFTSLGDNAIYYFTAIDEGSYSYRVRLFEVSIDTILRNPLFGGYDYIYSPAFQELKQGQGIIDIVNTYLGIALGSGLTGLALFCTFFVSIIVGVWRQMKKVSEKNNEAYDIGRSLLAALTCILVTIGTVSSITVIPVIYYLIAGLAVGYARWVRATLLAPTGHERQIEVPVPRRVAPASR